MDARFRIRTPEGRELEPRTLEIFSEMVRSGVVRPEDLVHDALTGEWVPAGEHPMVQLFQDPLLMDPLGLDLAEMPTRSLAEEAEAFIAQMEAERLQDPETPAAALELPLMLGADVDPTPTLSPTGNRPFATDVESLHTSFPAVVSGRPPRRRRRRPFWRFGESWLALSIGAGAILVTQLALAGDQTVAERGFDEGGTSTRVARGVPASEEEIRDAAFAGFLRGVDGVRGEVGLGEVPAVWLEGAYLSGAAARPEVRRYWERALSYVGQVQERETELYRTAYLAAAAEAGVSGPVRSLRMATALEDFQSTAPARSDRYDRMWTLATAALSLHDVLVELGDRVTYEPMRGRSLSADPVLEAAGTDEEAQALLEVALDRVLVALHGPDGAAMGDRSRISAWLVEGLGAGG